MRQFGDEEVEKPAELVSVAPQSRRQRLWVDVRRFQRANVELQPVSELLDAREDTHRVAFREAPVEQLDVVPHACFDATGRIDELERQIRRAGLRAELPLHADGVHALDDPVLLELRDGHGPSLPPRPDAEAGLVVSPVGDVVQERGRLLPPPCEHAAEVRCGQLARPVEDE